MKIVLYILIPFLTLFLATPAVFGLFQNGLLGGTPTPLILPMVFYVLGLVSAPGYTYILLYNPRYHTLSIHTQAYLFFSLFGAALASLIGALLFIIIPPFALFPLISFVMTIHLYVTFTSKK